MINYLTENKPVNTSNGLFFEFGCKGTTFFLFTKQKVVIFNKFNHSFTLFYLF